MNVEGARRRVGCAKASEFEQHHGKGPVRIKGSRVPVFGLFRVRSTLHQSQLVQLGRGLDFLFVLLVSFLCQVRIYESGSPLRSSSLLTSQPTLDTLATHGGAALRLTAPAHSSDSVHSRWQFIKQVQRWPRHTDPSRTLYDRTTTSKALPIRITRNFTGQLCLQSTEYAGAVIMRRTRIRSEVLPAEILVQS